MCHALDMKHPNATHPSQRFWSKVNKAGPNDCWEWTGARTPDGYGFMFAGPLYEIDTRWVRSNRLSYEMHKGPIPEGLSVLHHCDNPPCVNPAHLYAGTQQQNVKDRATRKRGKEHRQGGESNDNAKLTEADIPTIIEMVRAGKRQGVVGTIFGISQQHVSRIVHGHSWAHLLKRTRL